MQNIINSSKAPFSALLIAVAMLFSSSAWAIKKCQDAEGRWYYGDVAVAECENSKITTLNERGFVEGELEAPKTEEEIAAEEAEAAEQERLAAAAAREREERRRILSIYETEADIDRQRDNALRSVQSNIDVHIAYLNNMTQRIDRDEARLEEITGKRRRENLQASIDDGKQKMIEFKQQLDQLQVEKQEIIDRFAKEKEAYRELVGSAN